MVGIQAPKLVQVLLGAAAELLLERLFQHPGAHREFAAELLENRLHHRGSVFRCSTGKPRMKRRQLRALAKVIQTAILHLQESDLFEVRVHHSPTAAQIFVEAVFGEVGEHLPDLLRRGSVRIEFRILGDVGHA